MILQELIFFLEIPIKLLGTILGLYGAPTNFPAKADTNRVIVKATAPLKGLSIVPLLPRIDKNRVRILPVPFHCKRPQGQGSLAAPFGRSSQIKKKPVSSIFSLSH